MISTHTESATMSAESPEHSQPTSADTRSHWVAPPAVNDAKKADLEQRFESMRARNWITDRMVQQYQRHWHCTRETALERLLAKTSG